MHIHRQAVRVDGANKMQWMITAGNGQICDAFLQ
jgi:hypothetical protein